MDSGENGMNHQSSEEYWLSWGSNQWPPVLTFCTLPNELWGSAQGLLKSSPNDKILDSSNLKGFADNKIEYFWDDG